MAIDFLIDEDADLVRLQASGHVLTAEWVAVMDRALADPGYRTGMGFLMDRREITNLPTTAMIRDVLEFFAARASQMGSCRYASVTGDLAAYGMSRMKAILAEATTVEVGAFSDIEAAERWLRSPRSKASPGAANRA